ncbi:MAG: hypothetical protein FI707_13720 [SAR202 cluster bacterium]|jgi:hypothetical protein|nr:hypothetical protein [SAR202 cluster bacterium]MDP6798620.1 hypothetical protein [SAR202 cluster bacterium]MQG57677.1 hypothetical protein [SAR202 cluster bacterium]MQG69836.1 hypothetical protein [SAR202 cluster bacterium]HAL48425.1 hypothetical protein [Dehalococcoidia bacterium]|tara:strand:+ start:3296 stop:4369 length:1074 start_codon:yes stop_codon:yes gene_type:complete
MPQSASEKRPRRNRPFPTFGLEDVLRIARTIHEINSGLPMDRELLADAMRTKTTSSGFRMRLNSSGKYGLTEGGYRSESIALTELGRTAVAPASSDEQRSAYRTAATNPEVFRRFFSMLGGKPLPEDPYARNILARDMGVHPDLTGECLEILIANGRFVDLIRVEDGKTIIVPGTLGAATSENRSEPVSERPGEAIKSPVPPSTPVERFQPRVFVGVVGVSDVGDALRDSLTRLGVDVEYWAGHTGGPAGFLPTEMSDAMEDCAAGVLVQGVADGGDPGAINAAAKSTWLLVGAVIAKYGQNVILIEPAEYESAGLPVNRQVSHDSSKPEATVLSTIMALSELGVIRVVAGAASGPG